MAALILIGAVLGIAMLLVFRRLSNQEAIRRAKARLGAHLYEMRLFTDEPVLVWRAQWGLLAANVRYLGLMLLPAVAIAIPMVPLFTALEGFYGRAPLPPGGETVVTVEMESGGGAVPELRAPAGIAIETPGVRVDGGRQVSWRIRALGPAGGNLEFVLPGRTVTKAIFAGSGARYLSELRGSSLLDLVLHPGEGRLPSGPVERIELRYPASDSHWLVWLLAVSMLTALVLKRRFRVSF